MGMNHLSRRSAKEAKKKHAPAGECTITQNKWESEVHVARGATPNQAKPLKHGSYPSLAMILKD